jgi:hypothetical protein
MRARDVFRGWRGLVSRLAAGGLVVTLGISCAAHHGKRAKSSSAVAASAASAAVAGPPAVAGAPTGRFLTRASVDQPGAAAATGAGANSPGRELVEHALAGGGAEAGESGPNNGGTGVPVAGAVRRVGVVRVIGAHGRFVLIETSTGLGGVPVGEGQVLRCRGAASQGGVETAMLKVSPEREAPYLVADVVSGAPQTGDVAYFAVPAKR